MLHISSRDIRRHGKGNVAGVLWRQWRAERRLRRRGVDFRDTDIEKVAQAYTEMSVEDFEGVNARQVWANWRTIPRSLSDHVPDRPLRVLDLGCGTGGSTQVLAFYCPVGSHITGYEIAEPLVTMAKRRVYRQREGKIARVDFRRQSVTERFLDAAGAEIENGTVDVANAGGVVGHHLDEGMLQPVVQELTRVLKRSGIACLDVGPTLTAETLTRRMGEWGYRSLGRQRSWFGDPTGVVVFRWA